MQKLSAMTDITKMKDFAVDMLQSSRTDARKKSRLVNDVRKYDRPDKVLRLMWNAFLSGEGKGTIGSRYSKAMAEEVDLVEYFDTMNVSTFTSVINEAKSATGYEIYHKDFTSAVQHALSQVESKGYEVDEDEWFRKVSSGPRKPGRGKTNIYTIDLMKNGKPTPRKLQMQVYYDQGRYELNMYIS